MAAHEGHLLDQGHIVPFAFGMVSDLTRGSARVRRLDGLAQAGVLTRARRQAR